MGFASTSCCPIAEKATAGSAPAKFFAGGIWPSAQGSSNGTVWSNPNFCACSTSAAAPTFNPTSPNTTLQEI